MDSIIGLGIFLISFCLSSIQSLQILTHPDFMDHLKSDISLVIWVLLPFFILYIGTGAYTLYLLYELYKNRYTSEPDMNYIKIDKF